MSTSEVSICNKALQLLGEDGITSLDDRTNKAELCKLNYPTLRDAVIEARMWRFALIRKKSESSNRPGEVVEDGYPEWGDFYVHNIPDGMAQVFRCYKEMVTDDDAQIDWQREGDYILTPESLIYVWGVRHITDTRKFSPLFVEALAARIAAELAIPITQNRQLMVDHWQLYNDKISESVVRDGQQGRSEKHKSRTLLNARSR